MWRAYAEGLRADREAGGCSCPGRPMLAQQIREEWGELPLWTRQTLNRMVRAVGLGNVLYVDHSPRCRVKRTSMACFN